MLSCALTFLFDFWHSVIRSEIDGSIQMKCFLKGSPEISVGLNEDLLIGKERGCKLLFNWYPSYDSYRAKGMILHHPCIYCSSGSGSYGHMCNYSYHTIISLHWNVTIEHNFRDCLVITFFWRTETIVKSFYFNMIIRSRSMKLLFSLFIKKGRRKLKFQYFVLTEPVVCCISLCLIFMIKI